MFFESTVDYERTLEIVLRPTGASISMTQHCSRAGFSPEIDWPAECHADPGVSRVFQSMALELYLMLRS